MKLLRTPLVPVVLLVAFCASGFAGETEYGLDSTTNTALGNSGSTVFSAGERLDGWWKTPLGNNGSIFEGSAHFALDMDVNDDSNPSVESGVELDPSGDLDLLRFGFVFPGVGDAESMKLEAGRLPVRDPAGLLVSHPADGALLGFDYSRFNFSLQAGYTGLVLRKTNRIAVSLYDQMASADDSRVFGGSRLLMLARFDLPDVKGHSIALSFLAQQDLNPEEDLLAEWTIDETTGTGGKVDTQYSSIVLSGPVVQNLFYDAWFTFGSGRTLSWLEDTDSATGYSYRYVPILAYMAGFSVDYYRPALMNAAFNFRFLYASGDADSSSSVEGTVSDTSTRFVPLTSPGLGLVFSPYLSNLIVAELGGSVKPLSGYRIQTGAKMFAFFRATEGAMGGVSGLDPAESATWLGFETDLYGIYRITSDLGLSLNTGVFIPGISPSGAFGSDASAFQYSVQLALTLGM